MRSGSDRVVAPLALALASAAALSIAARPWGPGVVAWGALVPLIVALDGEARWWRGGLAAWLTWLGVGVVGFEGVLPVVPWAFAALLVLAGVGWAGIGAAYVGLRVQFGSIAALATLPALVTAAEFTASRRALFGDLANPVTALAYTQTDTPLLRSAGWSGTSGTTLLVVAINVVLVLLLWHRWRLAAVGFALVAAGVLIPVPGAHDPNLGRRALRIGMVQDAHPSIEVLMARMDADPASKVLRTFERLTNAVADEADLVVWGETSLPQSVRDGAIAATTGAALRHDVEYLVGARERSDGSWFNAVVHVRGGHVESTYRKRALVPLIESGFRRGDQPGTIPISGHVAGVGVCLDAMFGALARETVIDGADVLVYQTDDTFAARMATPELHARATAIRAVETARPVVFVNRSGPSVAFDARGHLIARLQRGEPAAALVEVVPGAGATPFLRFGDWIGPASWLWLAVVALGLLRAAAGRRASHRSRGGRPHLETSV